MRRILFRWLSLVVAMVLIRAANADTWQARVGGQSFDKGMQAIAFLPNEMWIHAGDSIAWTFSASESHSVTLLKLGQARPTFAAGCPGAPGPKGTTPDGSAFDGSNCVNSGLIANFGTTYTVSFPNPGNYVVVCLLHSNQSGTIHVLKTSETLPHDQEFYDRQASVEERHLLSDRDGGLAAKLREDAPKDRDEDNDDDSPHSHNGMHIVVMGAGELVATPGGAQSVSRMRFGRETITIHAGQTVEWASSDVSGHSVVFGQESAGDFTPLDPATASAGVVLSKDTDGTLHAVLTSTSDSVYSGRLAPASQERTALPQLAPGATRFRVTFTTPGTYPYVCAYHDEIGMKGEVVVLP